MKWTFFFHKPFVSQSIINLSHHLNRRRLGERHFLTKAAYYCTFIQANHKIQFIYYSDGKHNYQLLSPPLRPSPFFRQVTNHHPGPRLRAPHQHKKQPTTTFSSLIVVNHRCNCRSFVFEEAAAFHAVGIILQVTITKC